MPEENAYEKFTKREWAMALVSVTPGGSEFLTPDECTSYVRRSREYPRIIIELREQNKALRIVLQDVRDLASMLFHRFAWSNMLADGQDMVVARLMAAETVLAKPPR